MLEDHSIGLSSVVATTSGAGNRRLMPLPKMINEFLLNDNSKSCAQEFVEANQEKKKKLENLNFKK